MLMFLAIAFLHCCSLKTVNYDSYQISTKVKQLGKGFKLITDINLTKTQKVEKHRGRKTFAI